MQPKPKTIDASTIVIVDDDSVIRALVQGILSNQGYTTLCAQDGLEALELSRKHNGKIDLVVSDLVMPRMNGAALAERIIAERPETPILFISGSRDAVELPDHGELLQKPFGVDVLLCRVQQLLRPLSTRQVTTAN